MPNYSITAPDEASNPLCAHLMKEGVLSLNEWRLVEMQHKATQERYSTILTSLGILTYPQVIDALITIESEDLFLEQCFSDQLDGTLLRALRVMVIAERNDLIYVACLNDVALVHMVLRAKYPDIEFRFVPCDPVRLKAYQKQLELKDELAKASMMDSLLTQAASSEASDIHIVPKPSSFLVFFRILGVRVPVYEGTLEEYASLCARVKDKGAMDLAQQRMPQDGSFSFTFESRRIDLRVASTPSIYGEIIVLRLLDPNQSAPDLEGLGITRLAQWEAGVSRPNGLCLVCGPTSSGKSTTLNASLRRLDRVGDAVYSLENPVEMKTPLVGQVQVNPRLGLDFPEGLRAFMRLDPDVIVIGEIRDELTAKAALSAAETGHLVLATLHSESIAGAFYRLMSLGLTMDEIAPLIRSVMAQRLVRVQCKACLGEGCQTCSYTGASGRTLVSECEYFSEAKDVIHLARNRELRGPTIIEDAMNKYRAGEVAGKELLRVFGSQISPLLEQEGNKEKVDEEKVDG